MRDRIAVTGAGGFVGRHLTRHARSQGLEVVGAVRSEEASRAVTEAGGRAFPVPGLEPDALARAFSGARAVVHLAQIGAERPGATYESVNVQGTRAVVQAAGNAGVPRVVFLSGLGVARYGMSRRTTNGYFLSKLAAELELFRSGREAVVFRPSYIVGPGDGLVVRLLRQMAKGEVERPGDGRYRMQPVAVTDAAEAILAALFLPAPGAGSLLEPRVFDLVGPEPVAYRDLIDRLGRIARSQGKFGGYVVKEVPIEEADRRAASGGFHGMPPAELDCLLCDEVSDPGPLVGLLGRPLAPLDDALAAAVGGA